MALISESPLWRCPTCGPTFVTVNMPHSCSVVPLADHFRDRPGQLLAIYERLLDAAGGRGEITENVTKSRISFQTLVRFAGIDRPARHHLVANFVLIRAVQARG
jgi:hypothetical protein